MNKTLNIKIEKELEKIYSLFNYEYEINEEYKKNQELEEDYIPDEIDEYNEELAVDIENEVLYSFRKYIFKNENMINHQKELIIHLITYNYAYYNAIGKNYEASKLYKYLNMDFETAYFKISPNSKLCENLILNYFMIIKNTDTKTLVEEELDTINKLPISSSLKEENIFILDYLNIYVHDLIRFYRESSNDTDDTYLTVTHILFEIDKDNVLPMYINGEINDYSTFAKTFQKKLYIDAFCYLDIKQDTPIGLTEAELELYSSLESILLFNKEDIVALTELEQKKIIEYYVALQENTVKLENYMKELKYFINNSKDIKNIEFYTLDYYRKR